MPSFQNVTLEATGSVVGGDGVWRSNDLVGEQGVSSGTLWTDTTDFDHDFAGILQFKTSREIVSGTATVRVYVERVFGYSGAISCSIQTVATTGDCRMTAGTHFTAVSDTVSFSDQQAGTKYVDISITATGGVGLNYLLVTLSSATGGALLRNPEMQIYVDDGGVNPNATLITGGANIQTAVNAGSAGDLFYCRAGTYTYNGRVGGQAAGGYTLSTSGTASAKVMVMAYPSESPIIDMEYDRADNDQAVAGFVLLGDHILIGGFEVRNGLGAAIVQKDSATSSFNNVGLIIENCNIHDLGNPADPATAYGGGLSANGGAENLGCIRLDYSVGAVIRYSNLHHTYDFRTNGLESNNVDSVLADMHAGIHGFKVKETWIHSNDFHSVDKAIYQKGANTAQDFGHRVHNNYFYDINEISCDLGNGGAGESGCKYVAFYNNLSVLGSWASTIGFTQIETILDAQDALIYNNTTVGGDTFLSINGITDVTMHSNLLDNVLTQGLSVTAQNQADWPNADIEYMDYNAHSNGGAGTYHVITARSSGADNQYANITAMRGAYPSDAQITRDAEENSNELAPTYVNSGTGDYRTTVGNTINAGRFGRTIGIGSEIVGDGI